MSIRSMILASQAFARILLVSLAALIAVAVEARQIVFKQSELPARDVNADNCEFYVDGIAESYSYVSGYHQYKMWVELVSLRPEQSLGGWVRYRDRESGIVGEVAIQALAAANNRWLWEFDIEGVVSEAHFARDILEFAFYSDSKGPNDESVRSWISNRGRNFSWKETLTEPTYVVRDGQTEKRWADSRARVFDQKRVCAAR